MLNHHNNHLSRQVTKNLQSVSCSRRELSRCVGWVLLEWPGKGMPGFWETGFGRNQTKAFCRQEVHLSHRHCEWRKLEHQITWGQSRNAERLTPQPCQPSWSFLLHQCLCGSMLEELCSCLLPPNSWGKASNNRTEYFLYTWQPPPIELNWSQDILAR